MNPYGRQRYLSLDAVLKREFGEKVVKIPLNAGFSCPNRDGKTGFGGCSYCSSALSGEFAGNPKESLAKQFEKTKALYLNKWGETKYIAYLQAGSNTYSDVATLRRVYSDCLALPAVGLSIATRADCLGDEVLNLLSEINRKTYLTVELGLQSSNDDTANLINRGHSYSEFLAGYNSLRERNIRTCVHIINGLVGESRDDMLATARDVASLRPYEIKIHLMHVIKGTLDEKRYLSGELKTLSKEEYISIVCDQLEILPPETVIGRLTGDGDRNTLVAPKWSIDKRSVLGGIEHELKSRNSYQGRLFVNDFCQS
ncbi:MAG: TIGR01212 family radical SAM protein [Oscillospiraceae bacterium]|nr:TIGR01212 family radical SAM protein [Oscillospiraceae bacterium]